MLDMHHTRGTLFIQALAVMDFPEVVQTINFHRQRNLQLEILWRRSIRMSVTPSKCYSQHKSCISCRTDLIKPPFMPQDAETLCYYVPLQRVCKNTNSDAENSRHQ